MDLEREELTWDKVQASMDRFSNNHKMKVLIDAADLAVAQGLTVFVVTPDKLIHHNTGKVIPRPEEFSSDASHYLLICNRQVSSVPYD